MDLKGNAHKGLKQFVKIIKHIKNGTWTQISSVQSEENTEYIWCSCFITPGQVQP